MEIVARPARKFIPEEFKISKWEEIEPFFQELLDRQINNADELKNWFKDQSEFESVMSENLAWRYIKMTCDTSDKSAADSYQYYINEISPKAAPFGDKMNKKALNAHTGIFNGTAWIHPWRCPRLAARRTSM